MPFPGDTSRVWPLLTLRRTRALLIGLRYRVLVGLVALAYAFGAMVFGGMLYFPSHPLRTGWSFYIFPSGPGPSWAYPIVLVGSPYFQFGLPIISGILVTLSAAGVGLGMSLAVFLIIRLLRTPRAGSLQPTAVGAAAGLTPVMIALVTLGACCSTTAAATAGICLAAQASGTTAAAALANGWYLGVFQVAVIYVALIAQEQLLNGYGLLFESAPRESSTSETAVRAAPRFDGRGVLSATLRVALAVTGLTWSLSVLTDWSAFSPGSSLAAAWFGWAFQHLVPGALAVLVALFPAEVLAFWRRVPAGRRGLAIRGTLIGSGLALLTWMPVPLSGASAAALGNELLGFWGFPAGWGAVAPPALGLVALSLRWAFQFAVLGLVAIAMGISPETSLKPFLRSSAARGVERARGGVSCGAISTSPDRG